MTKRPRIFAGPQLRKLRTARGLQQNDLAQSLGISSSYLSQLEHDDRPLTPNLSERLATLFPIDWQDFAVDETERLAHALREAVGDPVFGDQMPPDRLVKLAEQQPEFARRFIDLHEIYRRTSQRLEVVDEAISVDSSIGARLPWEEVRDWFHISNNYVDLLDKSAEKLAESMLDEHDHVSGAAMRGHLKDRYGVDVVLEQSETLRRFDNEQKRLHINAGQSPSGIRFQVAYHLVTCSLSDAITDIASAAQLRTDTARELLKVGLANYAAGAFLMPYERFRKAAREFRHDIDRISLIFRTSFEQTCHRLSSLQRETSSGLPVFFCRVDMAGNITKRHSATQLQFARYGGACPLWIVHEAVAIPDRILVQLAEMPDGMRYVSMAKGLVKTSGRFDKNPRRYAVALGCEAKHSDDFVYADSIGTGSDDETTPIGVSCRICPRISCDQRAYPPSDQVISIDHYKRSVVPYDLEEPPRPI
ncbi:helix-turn-helix domain-containing protein [Aurantiacibacter rhizosphaerae]|uniref:ImmA/IrrE family metallo-endopeptidase n=1 Tax=Aurantiacibacter rhizosphaerae TaxID=2691582 RepID=A0A844XFK9_9SPHN|nr:helix-turn-helix transcriptional regulator [Aurantiacibacter rhizosphaerae]MWV29267.1 ImmA/IrrE family metallo-endopeptidase [Aurantiacibacter rhizosphaerae]